MKRDQDNPPDFRFIIAFEHRIGGVFWGQKPAIAGLAEPFYGEVTGMDGDYHMAGPCFDRPINDQQISVMHDGFHAVAIEAPIECGSRMEDEFVEIKGSVDMIFGRRGEARAKAHQRKRQEEGGARFLSGDK